MIEKLNLQQIRNLNERIMQNKINEIIDHLPQEKDICQTCLNDCKGERVRATCTNYLAKEKEPEYCLGHKDKTGAWITNGICNDCGLPVKRIIFKEDVGRTCCNKRVVNYSGKLTQEQIDGLLCNNCHKPMPKQPAKEVSQKEIVEGKVLHKWGKGSATGATEEWASIEIEKKATEPTKEVPDIPSIEEIEEVIEKFKCKGCYGYREMKKLAQEISALYRKEN